MAIIIKKRERKAKPKLQEQRVFRFFKRLDDGSFLIAGRVTKTRTAYRGYFGGGE